MFHGYLKPPEAIDSRVEATNAFRIVRVPIQTPNSPLIPNKTLGIGV